MSIALTVLGSSAMFATVDRACSGYLLEYGGARIWMDAGGGTWQNLQRHISYQALDGILLSHVHPDHTIDVFQCFHARMYGDHEPLAPIPLWGPEETIERLLGFYPDHLQRSFDVNVVAAGDSLDIAGARVSFVKMAHPPETLGMRVEHEGTVLAYTADTGPAADFRALAADADLLICEATFQESDDEWEGHLTAMQAGDVAATVGATQLLLTHLPAQRDVGITLTEAQKTSGDSEVRLAADGLRLEV